MLGPVRIVDGLIEIGISMVLFSCAYFFVMQMKRRDATFHPHPEKAGVYTYEFYLPSKAAVLIIGAFGAAGLLARYAFGAFASDGITLMLGLFVIWSLIMIGRRSNRELRKSETTWRPTWFESVGGAFVIFFVALLALNTALSGFDKLN